MKLKRKVISCLLILTLSVSGCSLFSQKPSSFSPTESTHAASSSVDESTTKSYEAFQENALQAQNEFDALMSELFLTEVQSSTINLHYTLKHPENYGISDYPVTFGELSIDQMDQDMKDTKSLKANLSAIDIGLLTEEQKLTYRILDKYLDTALSMEGFELYYEPLAPTIGVQAQLPILLCEYSFNTKKDVEDYLELLSQIDEYYQQIMDFEKLKAQSGLFMSDTSLDQILSSCDSYLLPKGNNFMSETFSERLNALELTEEEKNDYLAQDEKLLDEDFYHAYSLLSGGLKELKGSGFNDGGVCGFPEGKKYYEYLVNSNVSTSYPSIKKLKSAIESQMAADTAAMSQISKDDPSVNDQLKDYTFAYTKPEDILEFLRQNIVDDFPRLPECSYNVKHVPTSLEGSLSPAFYLTPTIDDFHDNVIYINSNPDYDDMDLFSTLAHEGFPGHLFQNVYFCEVCPNDVRQLLSFSSYSEGWATYVENYSYTLDGNGISPELGRLLACNSSATLALYALLDININYYGWDISMVESYLEKFFGITDMSVVKEIYDTLIATPTNYLEYYVGYLEIIKMKEKAEEKLGTDFNPKNFHTFLLNIGPAPWDVIQTYYSSWLMQQ